MNRKYTKGETLIVDLMKDEKRISTVGVVLGFSQRKLYLGHNFSGTEPIDTTSIDMESIISEERIDPGKMREVNSLSDLR